MSFGDEVHPEIEPPSRLLPDPLGDWPRFAAAVRLRLDAGRSAYGDRSFSAAPSELLVELQQEALDLAGWGFVLWKRLERLRLAAASLDKEQT